MDASEAVRRILREARRIGLEEGCGEPLALSEAIACEGTARHRGGRESLHVVCGLVLEAPPWLDAVDAGGITCTTTMPGRGLSRRSQVQATRLGFPDIARAWTRGELEVDVACVSVSREGTLGLTWGHVPEMVESVRRRGGALLVEGNAGLPEVRGAPAIDLSGAILIETNRPPEEMRTRTPNESEVGTARNVVTLIPDKACLSIGIGSLGNAVLAELANENRRQITFHSGMLGDGHALLADSDVIGDSTPLGDPPFTTSTLLGTSTLFDWAERDPRVLLRSTAHIHPPGVTTEIERFCAVNFALEVDLAGDVGAEQVGGRTVSGPGGQLDLATGACAAPGGRSIIALPATTRTGTSRIVPTLGGSTTTPASRVQYVVTEHGVAELWGRTDEERARRLIEIAAPEHREALRNAVYA